MRIKRSELRGLGKNNTPAALIKMPGEILAVWVGHELVNPMNAGRSWMSYRLTRYKNGWKEQTHLALKLAYWQLDIRIDPKIPKIITFQPYTANQYDEDGLQLALKWCRDTLVRFGVAHGDAPRDGHQWVYKPSILNRSGKQGVEIRVKFRDGGQTT